MFNFHFKSGQGIHERDGDVGVEVVAASLELGVRISPDLDDQVTGLAIEMGFAFGNKFSLHAVSHAGLNFNFQKMFLIYKSKIAINKFLNKFFSKAYLYRIINQHLVNIK